MLNVFSTPLTEGFYRAFLATLITFAVATAQAQQSGSDWQDAAIKGLIIALSPFIAGGAMALSDQARANAGRVTEADVPINIAAKRTDTAPAVVVGDFAPSKLAA